MLNYRETLEHVRAKQLVTWVRVNWWLYSHHNAIGNRQKALIRISFTVKHITKCLCFRLKNKYKFSTTIFFENEIDVVGNSRRRHYETDIAWPQNILHMPQSAFQTKSAFSAVAILYLVCIFNIICNLQSVVCILYWPPKTCAYLFVEANA